MNDLELAEEIERRATYIRYGMQVNREECDQIIAALRRERPPSGEMVMVSRESPATKQCSICLAHPPYGDCAGDEACAYILTLERRLSLAQTELKGHMRVEDDLRRDLASEVAIVNRVWKALGIETYDAAKPFAIDEHVTLLKARIAELEKEVILAGVALTRAAGGRLEVPAKYLTESGWELVRLDDIEKDAYIYIARKAIDAALKSRA